MILVLSVNDVTTLIQQQGIIDFFTLLINNLEKDFSQWQSFDKSPRHAVHLPHGVIEQMPICSPQYYACKYVNGHPNNPQQGKQTVVALGTLADTQSGYPLMVSEMTLLTALRTAATTALASKYLARPDSKKVALIGCGAQAEFLAYAHYVSNNIEKIAYYDPDSAAMEKFSDNCEGAPFDIEPHDNIQSAIKHADIIITATAAKKNNIILQKDWIQHGVHIAGIGGDCPGKTELDPQLLHHCKIFVEYLPQTKIEGEIQHLSDTTKCIELWQVITGEKAGRDNDQQMTLFDGVGFALEDYTILHTVYDLAKQNNMGQNMPLIPEVTDPKNLFHLIKTHHTSTA